MALQHKNRSEPHRRSNYGAWKLRTRDIEGLRLIGEQKFVRLDTLCEWFAPGYAKATSLYPPDDQPKASRGGDRSEASWPRDQRHRMMAVHRLVNRWCSVFQMAEKWQPWGDLPPWVRLTASGLAEIGHPDWPEIPWPDDERKDRLRDNGKDRLSHTHRVNKARLALARGDVEDISPAHLWHSEREIEIALPEKIRGVKLPHKTDGYVELQPPHTWTKTLPSGRTEVLQLPPGARVGIEVELSRKSFEVYASHVLPQLLSLYDAALYLAAGDAYDAIVEARKTYLPSNEERKRIRIVRFEPE